jgi:tetratricopeptide (TPR) repeat protein
MTFRLPSQSFQLSSLIAVNLLYIKPQWNMKKALQILMVMGCSLGSFTTNAQMTLPPGGGNQRSEVSQFMGLVKVTIIYNSPDVNGREIWGKLVPYGLANLNFGRSTEQNPSPWRVGANENTTITFSHDVEVEGKALKAGTYGLHMIPGPEEWVVIFSNNSTAWGSFFYLPSEDALRVTVKPAACEFNEFLTFDFTDRLQNSTTARLKWEKLSVPFKISVPNGSDLYVKKLREEMVSQKGFMWTNGVAAANFCANNKVNLEEALTWVQTYIDRGIKYFPIYNAKGNVLNAMNKTAEADATMKEAINLGDATAGQIVAYGRSLITQKRPKDAMPVFELAYKRYPTVPVALVGMARGYSANGDNKKALKFAQDAAKLETNAANKATIDDLVKKLEKGEAIN